MAKPVKKKSSARAGKKQPFLTVAQARARYAHGTRARYILARCRCHACRRANRAYENARQAAKRTKFRVRHLYGGTWLVRTRGRGQEVTIFRGRSRRTAYAICEALNREAPPDAPNALVDARPVRQHIRALSAAGVGRDSIAKHAGISAGVVDRLRKGEIRRTRRATAERILRVDTSAQPGATKVDSAAVWILIDRLVAVGMARTWIERLVGIPKYALTTRRQRITLARARALMAVYADLRTRIPLLRALEARAVAKPGKRPDAARRRAATRAAA